MTDPSAPGECKRCHGSGEVKAMTQIHGPDDYEVDIQCPDCGGTGAAPPGEATPLTDAICSPGFHSPLATLARSLERQLALRDDEMRGHMRIEDELRQELHEADGDYFEVKQQLAQAQARVAELEKDAARYRWLRVYPNNFFPEEENLDGERLDAAIDAAIEMLAAISAGKPTE